MAGVAEHVIGLDLGQSGDYSAVAIIGRTPLLDAEGRPDRDGRGRQRHRLDVVHLQRWPLGTPYPAVVQAVKTMLGRPQLARCRVGIDATGVGRAVVDMFLAAGLPVRPTPVTITGGSADRQDLWSPSGPSAWWVAKLSLVSAIQVGLGTGMLKVVPTLELAETLKRELLSFQVKVTTTANEQFGTWREGDHDDLVLATAIAAWLADHPPPTLRIW